jgi:Tfp pilus assembly protein PilN
MQVNLARQPFANRKLFWIAIWAIFFLSLSLGLWAFSEKTTASTEIKRLSSAVSDRERQVQQLKEEAEKRGQQAPSVQLTERDAYELAAARRLIAHKAFPWTKLINDIDERVPKNVRVLAIKVNETTDETGAVIGLVEVKAIGKTANEMTEMMTAFDSSGGLFFRGQSSQDQALDSNEVPFTINLIYRPFGSGGQ